MDTFTVTLIISLVFFIIAVISFGIDVESNRKKTSNRFNNLEKKLDKIIELLEKDKSV